MYYYNVEPTYDFSYLRKSISIGALYALLIALLDTLRYELFHQRFIIPLQTDLTPANYFFLLIVSVVLGGSLAKALDSKEAVYTSFFTAILFYFFNIIILIFHFTYLDYRVVYDFIPILKQGYPNYNPSVDYVPVLGIILFTLLGNIIIYIILVFPMIFGFMVASYFFIRLIMKQY